MRRLLFSFVLLILTTSAFSQVVFDLGLKAGVNVSNLNIEEGRILSDYNISLNSDAITKAHWGAFGRVGFGRLYVQPEVYFSKKGGDLSSDLLGVAGGFDYSNVDAPLLLGYKIIKGKVFDLHVMAGPVFGFVTDANYPEELDEYLEEEFFDDHLIGAQYGIGIDVLFLSIDARVEHASKIYDDPNFVSGNATTFMFTVGFKIL